MKRIYILLTLFLLTFSVSFTFADERHNIMIVHYKEKYPEAVEGIFYTLDALVDINKDLNNAYLVLTGQELLGEKNRITQLLQNYLDLHIILDVQEGDGLVENGSLSFGQNLVENISKLTIVNIAQDIQIIEDNFLYRYAKLSALYLTFLSQVTRIGAFFLWECNGLTYLDLPPSVTQIGDNFLVGCYRLSHLDLTPLSQVTKIGDHFLCRCTGLINLDLSAFYQVIQIGDNFLVGCYGLAHLDFFPLSQVMQIGNNFLAKCYGLNHLDLFSLSQVIHIGNNFLLGCAGLLIFDQLILPTYNSILRSCLEVRFHQNTEMGYVIRKIYIEGYVPVCKPTKSARH